MSGLFNRQEGSARNETVCNSLIPVFIAFKLSYDNVKTIIFKIKRLGRPLYAVEASVELEGEVRPPLKPRPTRRVLGKRGETNESNSGSYAI